MAKRLISLICIVLVLGIAGSTNAAYISATNITATASSHYNSTGYPIVGTINEAGLDTATLLHQWASGYQGNWWCQSGGDSTASPSGATGYCWAHYQFDQAYGLGNVWVWNAAQVSGSRGFQTTLVEYSTDGTNWTALGGGTMTFTQAPGENHSYEVVLNFADASASEVQITCIDNYGDPYAGLDEVRFNIAATKAINPIPLDKAKPVDLDAIVMWMPGDLAASHDVYIGTDFNDVNNAVTTRLAGDVDKSGQVDWADVLVLSDQWLQNPEGLEPSGDLDDNNNVNFVDLGIVGNDWKKRCEGNQDANSFDPGGLEPNTTYYWRVDEVNSNYNDSPWKGDVWSFTTCQGGAADCYYVAVDGNDNNPGTFEEPFATLEKARDTLRPLCLPDGGITVYLRGGKYFLENKVVLDEQDSGLTGKPIVYQSYPGEEARIIGGLQLDPNWFTVVTDANILSRMDIIASGYVMECNLAAYSITDYGQLNTRGFDLWFYLSRVYPSHMELCFNNEIMQLARWPNTGFESIVSTDGNTVFEYSGDRPGRWLQASDPWSFGYWWQGYHEWYVGIVDINTTSKKITLTEKPGAGIKSAQPWYALNLLEEIDSPGEYYIERNTGMLYFWPPNDINSAEILVSTFGENKEPLVDMDDVEYVTLRDITFETGRFDGMRIDNCSNVLVDGCVVRNLGGNGIIISGGNDCGVENCQIYQVNQGIGLSGGDIGTLTACNHFARNNDIHDFARWERCYRPGIYLKGVGCKASYNLIHDAPHFGIWYYQNNHTINFNEIHHVCHETDDAGAIYTGAYLGSNGTIIKNNFIHHIHSTYPTLHNVHAVYFDTCHQNTICTGNILYDIAHFGVFNSSGPDLIVENNVFVKCNIANYAAGQCGPDSILRRNIGWQNGQWKAGSGFPYYKEISNNIENENPLFYDEPNLVMALTEDSPVYDINGFERIPWEQIGLLKTDKACRPIPPDGWVDVEVDAMLYWAPAFEANSRDLYLGTDFDDVNNGNLSTYQGTLSEPNYQLPGIEPNTIYYWCVDERDANGDLLWSFTTRSGKAIEPNPDDSETGVSVNPELSWKSGAGAFSHDVYLGTNPTPGGGEFKDNVSEPNYKPATLEPNTVYYWRIDERDLGNQLLQTGNVWRFTTETEFARDPSPADKARNVKQDIVLMWTPGPVALSHDVYFGTDFNNVNDANDPNTPPGRGSQTVDANSYDPSGLLEFYTTYYWRIDESNDSAMWKGDVWCFTTCPDLSDANYISSSNITATASSTWWTVGPVILVDETGLDTAATGLLHQPVGINPYNSWINSGVSDGISYHPGTVTGYCWVACEFDQVYQLSQLWVWNWNQDSTIGRCLKDVTVQYSSDGSTWTTLDGPGYTYQLDKASGVANYAHDWAGPGSNEIDFGRIEAKYVVLTAHSSWGEIWYGLSELRFYIFEP